LKSDLTESETLRQNLEAKKRSDGAAIDTLKAEIRTSEEANRVVELQLQEFQNQITTLSRETDNLREKLCGQQDIEARVHDISEENRKLQRDQAARVQALHQRQDLTKQVSHLQREHTEAGKARSDLKRKREAEQLAVSELRDKLAEVQHALCAATSASIRKRDALEDAEKMQAEQVSSLKDQLRQKCLDMDRLTRRYHSVVGRRTDLQAQVDELKRKVELIEKEAEEELSGAHQKEKGLVEKVGELTALHSATKREINAVEDNTSN
ncbi:hypothetical protein MPER_07550, partial [Moniliophthora perniciosa FA553]